MRKLLLRAPVLTASGYGVHSRQILRALLDCGQFDVSVMPIGWGKTSFIFKDEPLIEKIKELTQKREMEEATGKNQYDLSVQVTIPNEFVKIAPVNVGVTAGIETDRVSLEWITKTNECIDLLLVPSRHSAEVFARTEYKNSQTNQIIKLQKPLAITSEGVDTSVFNTKPCENLFGFDTPFNFISVGLGFEKGFGEDRKNLSTLVKWFCEQFKDNREVGLILKSSLVNNSLMDLEAIKGRIQELKRMAGAGEFPRIHLVHGRLTDVQMASLYKNPSVKAFVTLTHGEGFGLPLLEAAACGLPVVATDWSGHLDFLAIDGKRKFVPIECELKEIPQSCVWEKVIDKGSLWAYPKEDDAKRKLSKVVLSYDRPKEWATELAVQVARTRNVQTTNAFFAAKILDFLERGGKTTNQLTPQQAAPLIKRELGLNGSFKSLIYTMPLSAGDVFISTAVVDSLKKKFPEHRIFFATNKQYQDILKENTDIYRVLDFQDWMMNVPFLEQIFDEVFTPNLAIQMTFSNWVRKGKGRLLGNEMAAQCGVEFGEYKIKLDPSPIPESVRHYIAFHPGSGKGQWEARSYLHWQEVVDNVKKLLDTDVVQLGQTDDPLYEGVIDLRGKTTYNQLASVVQRSDCLVGIDTVSMHMAAAWGTPTVAIFGSSYPTSTGPVGRKDDVKILLETDTRYTCEKACYAYQCSVDRDHPCINEISAKNIVWSVIGCMVDSKQEKRNPKEIIKDYVERKPKLGGYTHVLDAKSGGYPYVQSIESMLGFCDHVTVVDGGSTDGTLEVLRDLEKKHAGRLAVISNPWNWSEPGMDGQQKAFARAMSQGEFLWQQDADEVVHEEDYEKIRKIVKRFPRTVDLMSLPVVELWGDGRVRTDRHSWKWRLSRNDFKITHGIVKQARVLDEKTGKTYSKKGMSDGCEYIDLMTGEYVPHKNFYTGELESLRRQNPAEYGREMNKIFKSLPSVYHYSWADPERKIVNFKRFWNRQWSNLYNDPAPVDRFPDVDLDKPETVRAKVQELKNRGGEHEAAPTFELERSQPASMRT